MSSKRQRVVWGREFGTTSDGKEVRLVELQLGEEIRVKLSNFGATITSIEVPDCFGAPCEVVLGFDEHAPYENCPYFGCTVGRFANRIRAGKFDLDGSPVQLTCVNDRGNHLHGGARGWDKQLWNVDCVTQTSCIMSLVSQDGDEGYPGTMAVSVSFTLEWSRRLVITYKASCDKPSPVNLTNHSYFNLSDGGKTDVLDHLLMVNASTYLPTDANCLPTGVVRDVHGAMDLRRPVPIFRGLADADGGNGYDHNFIIDEAANMDSRGLKRAGWLRSPRTGIELTVYTSEPGAAWAPKVEGPCQRLMSSPTPRLRACVGIQVCAANHLDGTCRGRGNVFGPNSGICLETQHYPDSVNRPQFPNTILRPDQEFNSTTIYEFINSAASTHMSVSRFG